MELILSNPPAIKISDSLSLIDWAAIITDRIPDGQAIFSVTAGTEEDIPPLTDAVLAGLGPFPAWRQLPRITSSI